MDVVINEIVDGANVLDVVDSLMPSWMGWVSRPLRRCFWLLGVWLLVRTCGRSTCIRLLFLSLMLGNEATLCIFLGVQIGECWDVWRECVVTQQASSASVLELRLSLCVKIPIICHLFLSIS